jgi:ParB-like chromosome segregation protein Spo0J
MPTIKATVDIPLADITAYRKNPRRGNVGMIKESLELHGQYRAVVVNRGNLTGRTNEVLAGNHTVYAARELGWQTVAAHLVDVDDEGARKIVLADNRLSDIAAMDSDELIELLGETANLLGTGYTDDDVAALITPPEDMPEEDNSLGGAFDVIVVCVSAADQAALIARFEREGRQVRKVKSYSEV